MKIAILNKYQGKVARGAETFVYELGKRLSKKYRVDVISDVNYIKLFKEKYNVIIPTNGRSQVVLIRIISWLTGAKMIVSGQSGMGWDDRINLYSFPDAFCALSSHALEWAKRVNPLVKSFYIPNGVDLDKFDTQGQSLHVGLKKPIVLAVGSFTKQKRLNLAIDAVSRIKDVNLVIAGGGGNLKKQITDYGLKKLGSERFKVISVPFEKMPEVYRSANVFTLPSSSSESFGNVLVEAMASGLPIVATNDSIRHEIVGNAGILVNPINVEEYANALKKALEMNWEKRPREQAEKFSWDKIEEEYENIINRLTK